MNAHAETPTAASGEPLRLMAPAVLVALPFLFPTVAGPSANVWQLLAAWSCAALLLLTGPAAAPARGVVAWLGLTALSIALSGGTDPSLWLSACVAVGVIGLASMVGAGLARGDGAGHRALALGLLAAGLLSAVLGLLQYYRLAGPLVPWTTTPELGQAYGNLRQRNQFATLINMALIAGLWLHATGTPAMQRALRPAALLLMLAAAASTSRTGLLQLVLILAVAGGIAWRGRRSGSAPPSAQGGVRLQLPHPLELAALLAFYFAASWLLPQLAAGDVEDMLQRLREGAPEAHSRRILWSNVLELIVQHPWRGWGWGELSFAHYSHLYAQPRFVEILDNAHDLPLHLAVELGVPAAVLITGGFAFMVITARPWRERDARRLMAWGLIGVIALHSLLEYPLWYGPFQLAFGLCLGLLWPARGGLRAASPPLWWRTVPALLLIAMVGYAAWDYTRISQLYLARDQRLPAYRDDTLAKLHHSWLYAGAVQFAELTLTPVTRANAQDLHAKAERVLHFSPEPRVIVKLIDSAMLLGQEDEALAQAARFRIAFPDDYARWIAGRPVADATD